MITVIVGEVGDAIVNHRATSGIIPLAGVGPVAVEKDHLTDQ